MFKACIGLNCARQIDWIDRRNCQLTAVPEDIFRHEASLEELLLDTNMIQELPPVSVGFARTASSMYVYINKRPHQERALGLGRAIVYVLSRCAR